MGQYWKPVNLDKRECLHAHKLGDGLKLCEQLGGNVSAALVVLLAVMPERRGGGDLTPDPVIGRWAGDRIVFVGDYSEDADFPGSPVPFSKLYELTHSDGGEESRFTDISELVLPVLKREIAD